jgi:glycosyltransferase involved in cell wall biosynthesis
MFLSIDIHNIIKAVSSSQIQTANCTTIEIDDLDKRPVVGKKVRLGKTKNIEDLKIAFICNWGEQCGIATYTESLVYALRKKIPNIKIFAELNSPSSDDFVVKCWTRGQSMVNAISKILEWQPDIVHIQHEFGIFHKATHFLKMLEMLDSVPYVITLHSVYEHLDKTICTAYIKNIIVHSNQGKEILNQLGHNNNVYQLNHGCNNYSDTKELWNIFQNDYSVIQFGFGFGYKGVDIAIDAIEILKNSDPKFKDIFYCYLCSENPHTRNIHQEYYEYLKNKVTLASLTDNVTILRGFLSDKLIRNFLRTAKLAIFPYKTDPNNTVYGASGSIRHAMANGTPVIASDSHLFDDLEGVIPRINDAASLAKEIDLIFSNKTYKKNLIDKNLDFVNKNSWDTSAESLKTIYTDILEKFDSDAILIESYNIVHE